jgi:hypothetical protein
MRKRTLIVLFAAAVMLACVMTAYAHHSFAATYQEDKKITLEGKVVQFLMRNPHSFIHVEVTDESGKPVTWSIEGGGAKMLRNTNGDALKVGDKVQVICNPGRSLDAHRGRLISITRPADGWTWGNRAGQVVE